MSPPGPSPSSVAWLLDTNVLSEAVRVQPNARVMDNLVRHQADLAVPAPVWHELRYGWLRMPDGQRKDAIGRYLSDVVSVLPVLPYDAGAARVHAELRADLERAGRPLPFVDGQIAAIAIAQGLTLVTCNVRDFSSIAGLRWTDWFAA
ncbi:type II toxin-antitoxin system VapC family toxin [Azohydromonas lata]|uniref:Ribonuclease VapC n=1 Tax=Azohydromonas lata TaxID=45677 RepID=A0ABU5IE57_9BURK|nr:type II toxin-antitoxin system VapC family toxin [Azohydromonas lata]MDZ5457119.1 type II toxin-antitoxin system VapC family toxin [Azohydromonas lata]